MKEQHNKRLDIVVELGIQSWYERIIVEFPKLRAKIEMQKHNERTKNKRYYHNWKVKKNFIDSMNSYA